MDGKLVWLKDYNRQLAKVQPRLRKNLEKRVMRKAVKPVREAVKALAPKDSGALRTSVAGKVDSVRGGLSAYAVVGSRKKYQKVVKKTKARPKAAFLRGGQPGRRERTRSGPLVRKPFKYIHLAEKKHRFLRRAWSRTRGRFFATVKEEGFKEIMAALRS